MEDFYYGGKWLSELGGRLTQKPQIEIAERDCELIEIPGKSGDVFLDNNRYKNVEFTRSVGFVNRHCLPTRQQINKFIEWLGYQIGYQEFRDTQHPNSYTKAVLLNMGEVIRDLRNYTTTTLKFSRIPYWYDDFGQNYINVPNDNKINIYNPRQLKADADFRIYAKPCTTDIYININDSSFLYPNIEFTNDLTCFSIDQEHEQIILINYDTGFYRPIEGRFPRNLRPDRYNEIKFTFSLNNFEEYREQIIVKPNWRYL